MPKFKHLPNSPIFYPIPDAAKMLGISLRGAYYLIERRRLHRVKIGKRMARITAQSLDDYIGSITPQFDRRIKINPEI
jgi:excisionase family DNA binding protein